jgi:DNA ligase-1
MEIIKPMLLSYGDEPFTSSSYLHEPKWDGLRLLIGKNFSYTRHGIITSTRFRELHFDIGEEVLLDGELIAPGVNAPDDFAKAMSRFSGNKDQPIQFIAFDILSHKNKSIKYLPIEERKGILTEVLAKIDSPFIIPTPYVLTEGEILFNVIKEKNMEGSVAKRLGSTYTTNSRSKDWLKIINWSVHHDFVVSKITYRPLTVQLQNFSGEYMGSVNIGFTKEIREELLSRKPPFTCTVKARGWTSGKKLRLPQIVKI